MYQDIKTAALNYPLSDVELTNQCRAVYGGVAWSGKRPGCAVIVAMLHEKHLDSHDIYLLEEYEDFDTRQLVRRCGAMDAQYKPAMWIGDNRNNAADQLINEMAGELEWPPSPFVPRRSFYVSPTMMVEMNQLYAYILSHLKRLLDPERRTLFLKDSRILSYLSAVQETEIGDLQLGDYPAIEALAFAVIEMRNHYPPAKPIRLGADGHGGDETNRAKSYATKTAFR